MRPDQGIHMNEPSASAAPPFRPKPRAGLFVTCLVDIIRPTINFATVKLLENAGCMVVVPGRPAAASRLTTPAIGRRPKELARQERPSYSLTASSRKPACTMTAGSGDNQ